VFALSLLQKQNKRNAAKQQEGEDKRSPYTHPLFHASPLILRK